jgi:hypothetical protein
MGTVLRVFHARVKYPSELVSGEIEAPTISSSAVNVNPASITASSF